MLAQRADVVLGKLVALVNEAADLADVAFLACGLGLGLDVVLIVGVGHCLLLGDDARLNDGADEHSVRSQIDIVLNLEREERVELGKPRISKKLRQKLKKKGDSINVKDIAQNTFKTDETEVGVIHTIQ